MSDPAAAGIGETIEDWFGAEDAEIVIAARSKGRFWKRPKPAIGWAPSPLRRSPSFQTFAAVGKSRT